MSGIDDLMVTSLLALILWLEVEIPFNKLTLSRAVYICVWVMAINYVCLYVCLLVLIVCILWISGPSN